MNAIIEPREAAIRRAFQAAAERGEIATDIDVELLSAALPALLVYRLMIRGQTINGRWQHHVVDRLLIPAARDSLAHHSGASVPYQ
jgi:hypothetical protein